MHLCTELTATPLMFETFKEVGANFSLQLSSQTHFAKIENTNVIGNLLPKNNMKNIKIEFKCLTNSYNFLPMLFSAHCR